MEAASFDDPAAFEAEVRRLVAYVADLERLRADLLATEHEASDQDVAATVTGDTTAPVSATIADLKAEIWRREGILAEARPLAALPEIKAALCPHLLAAPPDGDLVALIIQALLPLTTTLPRDPAIFAGIIGLIARAGAMQYCSEAGA